MIIIINEDICVYLCEIGNKITIKCTILVKIILDSPNPERDNKQNTETWIIDLGKLFTHFNPFLVFVCLFYLFVIFLKCLLLNNLIWGTETKLKDYIFVSQMQDLVYILALLLLENWAGARVGPTLIILPWWLMSLGFS